MNRLDHPRLQPLFTTVLLLLGLFALAMAQNSPAARNAAHASALNQLLSGHGQAMISQPVTLSDVSIQDTTEDDILWVGASPDNTVLVMLQPSVTPIDSQGNPVPIASGDLVRVTGHVLRAPSTQILESWGISPAEAARVQRQGVVLQAVTFEVTKRNP